MQIVQEEGYLKTIVGRNDEVAEKQTWDDPVRNMDGVEFARKGDSFTIPNKPLILTTIIGGIRQPDNTIVGGTKHKYCVVELTKKSGEKVPMRFFPNMLAKVAMQRDQDASYLGRVKTSGTASALFQSFVGQEDSMNKAMEALAGKTIKVFDEQEVTILPYQKSQEDFRSGKCKLEKTRIFVYDLVEEPAPAQA